MYKDADLFDFINAPIGKGLPVTETLRPLIAVPTTAGTGSETTGTAILDIPSLSFKTGEPNIRRRISERSVNVALQALQTARSSRHSASSTRTTRTAARASYILVPGLTYCSTHSSRSRPFREYIPVYISDAILITSVRYTERTPRPSNPKLRPAYQGSNPIADVFSMWALRQTVEHLPRMARNPEDREAKQQMLCVSCLF